LAFWPFGLLAFWPFGLLAFWPFGLLAFWPFGLWPLGPLAFGLLGLRLTLCLYCLLLFVCCLVLLVEEVHRSAFNVALLQSTESRHSKMMTVAKFTRIVNFLTYMQEGQSFSELQREGYQQAFQWGKKYKLIRIEEVTTLVQKG
jgi:hypothetical protein